MIPDGDAHRQGSDAALPSCLTRSSSCKAPRPCERGTASGRESPLFFSGRKERTYALAPTIRSLRQSSAAVRILTAQYGLPEKPLERISLPNPQFRRLLAANTPGGQGR